VEKGGQTTVAKEFAIYFKIKVSKSMTNSVRYVFAHCSRPIPFVHPPHPCQNPPRSGDIWWGAADLFAYNSAADTAKIQKKIPRPDSSPRGLYFFSFLSYAHFWRQRRRVDWVGCSCQLSRGVCKRGVWGAVGCRRSSWKIHSKSKIKMPANYKEGGVSVWQRTYF